MDKVDFKKKLKQLYSPPVNDFVVVEVPKMNFLMIDGQGDPNTSESYQQALKALYSLAYAVKFASKGVLERDYTVPPLEGLWWADDMDIFTTSSAKDAWRWTMMIMQPDWVGEKMVAAARLKTSASKHFPALDALRFESYHEGLSVQIMHIGPYAQEGPTLLRLHEQYLPEHGLREAGKHHEIYLSDPRRTEPARLKTILRQPVQPVG